MIIPGGIPGRAGRVYVSIKFTFPTVLIYRYLLLLEAGETGIACAKEMYLGRKYLSFKFFIEFKFDLISDGFLIQDKLISAIIT